MKVIVELIKIFISSFKKDPMKTVTDMGDIKIQKTFDIPYSKGSSRYNPENEKPPILKEPIKLPDDISKYPLILQDTCLIVEEQTSDKDESIMSTNVEKVLITNVQFLKIFPKIDLSLIDIIINSMKNNNIDTLERVSCFLAQCGHESVEFTKFKENLNYSTQALLSVFKKYFQDDIMANKYARNPEKIANKVYANRMGNGSEESGDGWKFRGRGIIQLTGKNNYQAFANYCNKTLEEVIIFLTEPEGIVQSAIWYWNTNNLNKFADSNDFIGLSKKINGGANSLQINGLQHRQELYDKVKQILSKNV